MKNTWSVEIMKTKDIKNKIEKNIIEIPDYQRGAVWSKAKKEKLINSINRGIPFGAILLYKKDNEDKYLLIDGLQRCLTINEFIKNPTRFFIEENIDIDIIEELIKFMGYNTSKTTIAKQIINEMIVWLKEDYISMDDVKEIQYTDCTYKLAEKFPVIETHIQIKKVTEIIKPIFKEFVETCKQLSEANIPAIIIEGDDGILPEVFERINSEGAKLTKQQVYAAVWSNYSIKITDGKLKKL